jgi:hypothetical protein
MATKPSDIDGDTEVYETIAELGGDTSWVALARLRPYLAALRIDRAHQDASLVQLSRTGRIVVASEDNQKSLRREDHAAAIWLGNQNCHIVTCQR